MCPEYTNGEVAEREGFEPPSPRGLTVFKTAAFDRSATSPFLETPAPARYEHDSVAHARLAYSAPRSSRRPIAEHPAQNLPRRRLRNGVDEL